MIGVAAAECKYDRTPAVSFAILNLVFHVSFIDWF
jgi:hypothetical protein